MNVRKILMIGNHMSFSTRKIMESNSNHYDLITIGAGSGGVASSRWAASKYKKRVLIIEKKRVGGTCVNVGCVPKKVMWMAANFLEDAEFVNEYYGIQNSTKLDFAKLVTNRQTYIKRLNNIYLKMLKENKVDLVEGTGRFINDKTIDVEGKQFTADHILISVGSEPHMEDSIKGIEHCISSDGFFDLKEIPERAIVLGGGYIALECAQILHQFGCKTTQFVRRQILNPLDDDVRNMLLRNLKLSGFDIRFGKTIVEVVKKENGKFDVKLNDGSVEESDIVLMATGRRACVKNLGLENTGVKVGLDGTIEVDDYENTAVKGVYAIGDANNKIQLTPVAIQAGRLLMERIFGGRDLKMNYENVPTIIFSHPPIGMVGLSEAAAREKYGDENVVAYRSSDNNMFYSVCEDPDKRPNFLYKIVCLKNENERIVGLHGCGRGIDEFLQGFGVAIRMGATKKDFDNSVAIHPTAAESLILIDPKF